MELSLYRKYRPQTFAEIAGQDHVSTTLQNAVRSGTVAHAYVFSGSRGTGKTSTAKILAKALNCTGPDAEHAVSAPTVTPCGVCDSCRSIAASTAPRRDRDGRRLQPRHRRHPRAARQGRLRPGAGPLQGLHRRRGSHADQGGLQRPPEDTRGATGARRLRAGHDRGSPHSGDHPLALPALRLPAPARARHRARGRSRSPPPRRSRSTSPPCSRSRATPRAVFATPSARSRSFTTYFGEAPITSREVLDVLGVIATELLFEIVDVVIERDPAAALLFVQRFADTAPATRSSSTTCCATCARCSS